MKRRLSRRGQIIRDLILILVVGFYLWGYIGFPLFFHALDFRRVERANWVGPSQYFGSFEDVKGDLTVGAYEDQILCQRWYSEGFSYWPRNPEGATLLPTPDQSMMDGVADLMAVEAPAGTQRAQVTYTVDCWWTPTPGGGKITSSSREGEWEYGPPEHWSLTGTQEGEEVAHGVYLFHIQSRDQDQNGLEWRMMNQLAMWEAFERERKYLDGNARAEVVFYDGNGLELGRTMLERVES